MNTDHIDPLHHIGDTLLFENDRVRIWSLTLEPGQESPNHQHPLDYVLVTISGDRIGANSAPGQDLPYPEQIDVPTHAGQTVFLNGGITETAVNTGTTTYSNILVELKETV